MLLLANVIESKQAERMLPAGLHIVQTGVEPAGKDHDRYAGLPDKPVHVLFSTALKECNCLFHRSIASCANICTTLLSSGRCSTSDPIKTWSIFLSKQTTTCLIP